MDAVELEIGGQLDGVTVKKLTVGMQELGTEITVEVLTLEQELGVTVTGKHEEHVDRFMVLVKGTHELDVTVTGTQLLLDVIVYVEHVDGFMIVVRGIHDLGVIVLGTQLLLVVIVNVEHDEVQGRTTGGKVVVTVM